jgi:hypothetical protein
VTSSGKPRSLVQCEVQLHFGKPSGTGAAEWILALRAGVIGLLVVHIGGITQCAGDVISFGITGISEIARSLP